MKKKKSIERICKNCRLYNPKGQYCSVIIIHEGRKVNLPMEPQEKCFFEENYFNPTTESMEDFAGDIKEIKAWVEDENGNKVGGNGIVKIEIPTELNGPSPDAD